MIRTDIYKDTDQRRTYIVFGDWGYGEEGNSYENTQYGDPYFEEKLQGDDDIIMFGDSDGNLFSG